MKETGVIRRIDELGRIVIPKEIRKRLRINCGEQLDIFTQNNQIILSKYSPLSDMIVSLNKIVDAIKKEVKSDFIICDKTKVLISTISEVTVDSEISDTFINALKKDNLEILKTTNINITADYKNEKYLLAKKIIDNGDCYGYVVIFNDNLISRSDREMINILTRYVMGYIAEGN